MNSGVNDNLARRIMTAIFNIKDTFLIPLQVTGSIYFKFNLI